MKNSSINKKFGLTVIEDLSQLTNEEKTLFRLAEAPFQHSCNHDINLGIELRSEIIRQLKLIEPVKYSNLQDNNIETKMIEVSFIISNIIRTEHFLQFYGPNWDFMAQIGNDEMGNYIIRFPWSIIIENKQGALRSKIYGPKAVFQTAFGCSSTAMLMSMVLVNAITELAKSQELKVIIIGISRGGGMAYCSAISSCISPQKVVLITPIMPSHAQLSTAHRVRNALNKLENSLKENLIKEADIRGKTLEIRSKNYDFLVDTPRKILSYTFLPPNRISEKQIQLNTGRFSSGHLNWDPHMSRAVLQIDKNSIV